jgi:hypothetical protein
VKYQKNRVQVMNPITGKYVKINTEIGGIIGHKSDKNPYKNVMTREQRDKLHPENKIPLEDVRIKIDPKYAKQHIQCDCGHYAKDHFLKEGCCDKCGCTWYYPNYKWIIRQKRLAQLNMKVIENENPK